MPIKFLNDVAVDTSVLYVDTINNRVGIGTTSPTQLLHVSGNARVTGAYYDSNNSAGTSGQVLSSTATGTDWVDGSAIPGVPGGSGTAGKIVMWQDSDTLTDSKITQTAGSETNYVDVDFANVEDLTITGDSGFSSFTVNGFDAVNFTGIENNFNVGSGDLAIATNDNSMNLGGGTADSDTLTVGYPTTRFIGSGNVGIGTTSPSEKLEIAGNAILDASNANLKIKAGTTGTKGDIQWTFNTDSNVYASAGITYDNRATDGFLIDSGYPITLDYASSYIRFSNNGSEKMRINTSGNVGIGTTSPGAKLEVNDSANDLQMRIGSLTAGISPFFRLQGKNTANTTNYYADIELDAENGKLIFKDPGTSSGSIGQSPMAIDSSGNVGIGTTSPNAKLDVNGAGNFSGGTVVSGIDTSTNVGVAIAKGDYLYSNDGNYLRKLIGQQSGGAIDIGHQSTSLISDINFFPGTSGNIKFFGSGSEDMRINSSGNVGIGTTSPSYKLEVADGDIKLDDGYEILWDNNGTVTAGEELVLKAGTTDSKIILDGSDSAMQFITGNSTAIAINDAQNVGIGTTSPQAQLHIGDSQNSDSGLRFTTINGGNNDAVNLHFLGTQPYSPFYISRKNTGGAEIQLQYDGDIILNGNNGDNVGIGTTLPQQQLHVAGASLFGGNIYFGTGTSNYINGNGGGFNVYANSNLKFAVKYGGHTEVYDDLEVDGDMLCEVVGKGLVLKSPNGTRYRIKVDNSGNLSTETY